MQIEWSKGEVLKSAGVGREAEVEVVEGVGRRIDGGKRWDTGREVGIRLGAGRTGAERGEPCRVFRSWIWAAVSLSMTTIRPPQLGQRQSGLGSVAGRGMLLKRRRNSLMGRVTSTIGSTTRECVRRKAAWFKSASGKLGPGPATLVSSRLAFGHTICMCGRYRLSWRKEILEGTVRLAFPMMWVGIRRTT
jgi:hypothetical protein